MNGVDEPVGGAAGVDAPDHAVDNVLPFRLMNLGVDARVADNDDLSFQEAEEEKNSGPVPRLKYFLGDEGLGRALGHSLLKEIISGKEPFQKGKKVSQNHPQCRGAQQNKDDLDRTQPDPRRAQQGCRHDDDAGKGGKHDSPLPHGFMIPVALFDKIGDNFTGCFPLCLPHGGGDTVKIGLTENSVLHGTLVEDETKNVTSKGDFQANTTARIILNKDIIERGGNYPFASRLLQTDRALFSLQFQTIIFMFSDMNKNIGFVGLGLMGSAMAARLQQAGYALVVYNRTKEKASTLLKGGAEWAESPGAVASRVPVVFSMLSTPEVLREVATGSNGIVSGLSKGGIHVDCSTVSPAVTRALAAQYASAGKVFLHCPVLGSVPQAAGGALLLMVGGDASAVATVEPILNVLGSKLWKFPSPDQASHTKLLCNLFIAGAITTLSQALVFADKASVPASTLLDIVGNSALNSPTYQAKGKSILERNFAPRFYVEHMLKDVNLMIEAAKDKGVSLPAVQVTQQLLSKAVELGYGKEDYSAIIKALETPQ